MKDMNFGILNDRVLYIKSYPVQSSFVEGELPVPQNVTVFGDRGFKVVN
jgi:hypothetical protein